MSRGERTLVSVTWSHAPGRALLDFDRTLLYGLCLLFAATLASGPGRLRWVMNNAFAFGGLNSALLLRAWEA